MKKAMNKIKKRNKNTGKKYRRYCNGRRIHMTKIT